MFDFVIDLITFLFLLGEASSAAAVTQSSSAGFDVC